MRIVVDIGHPSQVHFFKNFIWEMQRKGHQVFITVTEKDVAPALLRAFGFEYKSLGSYGSSLLQKILNVPIMDMKMYQAVKQLQPDIFLGFGSIRAAHAAWLMGKPSIIFDDDEFTFPYYKWFASTICGFSGFRKKGKKIIKIPSFKELAYLHPKWFSSNIADGSAEPLTILRFVSRAFHDVGKAGFNLDYKRKLVKELGKYSKVVISSEIPLPADLESYRAQLAPIALHAFLKGATLLVSESGTMSTEAAVMGVPVVRCNSFVGHDKVGNFVELEKKYNLIFNFQDPQLALAKALELIQTPDSKAVWEQKKQVLLGEKIAVTPFMVWFVENYPASIRNAQAYFPKSLGAHFLER